MKHKVKVVMIPTDSSKLYTDCNNKLQLAHKEYSRGSLTGAIFQHLYITVAQDVEPIKEGDWIYDTLGGKVVQWYDGDNHDKHDRKIIATNDPKLNKIIKNHNDFDTVVEFTQLQKSFLKEYCANPNGEYEVEYEYIPGGRIEAAPDIWKEGYGLQLKLNQDNEVSITSVGDDSVKWNPYNKVVQSHRDGTIYVPVEEKMHSSDEVIELLAKYSRDHQGFHAVKFHDWITDNL